MTTAKPKITTPSPVSCATTGHSRTPSGLLHHLRVEYRPADHLQPADRNARTHSPKQIRQIADSIRRFGFINPILTNGDGQVIERPAPVAEVVDSTGAGDVFAAGLAYALARDLDMEQALGIAVAWGSASVRYLGTQPPPGFPEG